MAINKRAALTALDSYNATDPNQVKLAEAAAEKGLSLEEAAELITKLGPTGKTQAENYDPIQLAAYKGDFGPAWQSVAKDAVNRTVDGRPIGSRGKTTRSLTRIGAGLILGAGIGTVLSAGAAGAGAAGGAAGGTGITATAAEGGLSAGLASGAGSGSAAGLGGAAGTGISATAAGGGLASGLATTAAGTGLSTAISGGSAGIGTGADGSAAVQSPTESAASSATLLDTAKQLATVLQPALALAQIAASRSAGNLMPPSAPAPVTLPTRGGPNTIVAQQSALRQQLARRGRASTILTSPGGEQFGSA